MAGVGRRVAAGHPVAGDEQRPVEAAAVVRDEPARPAGMWASSDRRAAPARPAGPGAAAGPGGTARPPTSRGRRGTRACRRPSRARSSRCRGRRAGRPAAAGRAVGRGARGRAAGRPSAARSRTTAPSVVRDDLAVERRGQALGESGRAVRAAGRAAVDAAAVRPPTRRPEVREAALERRRRLIAGRRPCAGARARRAAAARGALASTSGSRRGPVQAGQPASQPHAAISSAAPAISSSWRCQSRSDSPTPPGTASYR